VSGTVSLPAGSTISALMSRTTRFDCPGATFETISSTLKNWLRKAMLPGMMIAAGNDGIRNLSSSSWSSTRNSRPLTLTFGTCSAS